LNTLELAELHLDLLYGRDGDGLMAGSRDPAIAAPIFHLVRTVTGNRWLLLAALPRERRAELEAALAAEPVVRDLAEMEGRPPVLNGILPLIGSGRTPLKEYRGPAFVFPESLPQPGGEVEVLTDPASALTVPELAWVRTATATEQPLAVARDPAGNVVAVCHSARSTARAAEAGVETAPAYRGRGLAGSVVAAWAAAVRTEGCLPFYGAAWTNPASRAVARKLGLIPFSEDFHIG
jgi:GNAT superfamily N-acetyltransferase